MEVFLESRKKWLEMMASNQDWSRYGFVDILGLQEKAYGTEYPRL